MTVLHPLRYFPWIAALLASACAIEPLPESALPLAETSCAGASADSASVPVTRQGRYTLVEMAPEAGARDLLRQIVEVSIPPTLEATVEDALRHLLRQSGYRLCENADEALRALPLPAAHRRLGPLTLREALETLAGPAWVLAVDDFSRQVCFTRRASELSGTPRARRDDGRTRP
ncbi:MAG: PilL N-terminal domain-containing protein [Candidatus Accumulibacter sp.]|jgi:type IV pili sensor histidine kinase/response regulator|nr:PilL N-terminal domain-containing protein [Accumulibacter sp.]